MLAAVVVVKKMTMTSNFFDVARGPGSVIGKQVMINDKVLGNGSRPSRLSFSLN